MFEGLFWLFQKLGIFFTWFFALFGKVKGVLPKSFLGFFILIKFFSNFFTSGFNVAFEELAKSILSAEMVIRENVLLAINDSVTYGIAEFVEIFFSLMILWYFVTTLMKAFDASAMVGKFGQFFWAVLIVAIIETSTSVALTRSFTFIPIYDGVFFLAMNLAPVFGNIHFFGV